MQAAGFPAGLQQKTNVGTQSFISLSKIGVKIVVKLMQARVYKLLKGLN